MDTTKVRSIRLDDEIWERVQALPGKTINDALRVLMDGADARISKILQLMEKPAVPDTRIDEILEHAQSQVSIEDIQEVFENAIQAARDAKEAQRATNPAAVPGVQQGYAGLGKPRYESRADRDARERQEKMDKARARSSVGDDPSYVFDPEYVQD